MNYLEINKKLQDSKNWTNELLYVHRTRLILGIAIGFVICLLLLSGCRSAVQEPIRPLVVKPESLPDRTKFVIMELMILKLDLVARPQTLDERFGLE